MQKNDGSSEDENDTANDTRKGTTDKSGAGTQAVLQDALNNTEDMNMRNNSIGNSDKTTEKPPPNANYSLKDPNTSVENNENSREGATRFDLATNSLPDTGSANRCESVTTARPTDQNSMWSVGSLVCRICHTNEHPERLVSPCLCKGTLAYVHRLCLEHWLSTSGTLSCELCHFNFRTEHSLRYTLVQSLRLWYKHPNNRGLLQADFFVCSLLTVVSFGLIGICMMGLQHFILQGKRLGISKWWTQGSIIVFLMIIAFVYFINLFLILKSQLVPWYRWWQSAREVKLILVDRKPYGVRKRQKSNRNITDEVEIRSTLLSGQNPGNESHIAVTIPT